MYYSRAYGVHVARSMHWRGYKFIKFIFYGISEWLAIRWSKGIENHECLSVSNVYVFFVCVFLYVVPTIDMKLFLLLLLIFFFHRRYNEMINACKILGCFVCFYMPHLLDKLRLNARSTWTFGFDLFIEYVWLFNQQYSLKQLFQVKIA